MATRKEVEDALRFLQERKTAYQLAFGGPAGTAVLEDLAPFCRANTPCWDPDPRVHALLEGRREVWLRIQNHLSLNAEELLAVFSRDPITITQENPDG